MSVNQTNASTAQGDLATPLKTGRSEIASGLFQVRHRVRIVIAEHKVEWENRAGLDDVPPRQVTTVKERLGSGSDKNLDRPLRSFEPVLGIGKHSKLHKPARARKRPLLCRFFAVEKTAAHSTANDFSDPQFQLVLRRQLGEALRTGSLLGN